MLGKFTKITAAQNFSNRLSIASTIMLGDDDRFWVVTLAEMERLISQGYQIA